MDINYSNRELAESTAHHEQFLKKALVSTLLALGFIYLVIGAGKSNSNLGEVANNSIALQFCASGEIAPSHGVFQCPIEEIGVGMRVLASNPEVTDEERAEFADPQPKTWRKLRLELVKADEGVLDIEMIRPLQWIAQHNAKVGSEIFLNVPELGAVGHAQVIEITSCPKIQDGDGQVVVTTFAHPPSHQILDIEIEGKQGSETLGVTTSHPIWNVERKTFVPAGELKAVSYTHLTLPTKA